MQPSTLTKSDALGASTDGGNVLRFPDIHGRMPSRMPMLPRDRMTFHEVAVELCLDWYARDAQIIDKLRALHRHQAMPLPENPRFVKGVPCKGADNICAHSIWSRRKFMAWRERGVATTPSAAETRATLSRLSRNAAILAGGGA